MNDMPDLHALQAEAQLAVGRLRGLFRLLATAAQSDAAIDNETLGVTADNGMAAADDAQQALEKLLAQVFSLDRAA
jgi:hypothetical protein